MTVNLISHGQPRSSKIGQRVASRLDTRNALVWCGTELLTERGFQITGIDEILKRVGVPKGSFYHYFKSKDDFGHAVIDNYEAYYAKKMDRIFGDTSQSPLHRLINFTENAKNGMVKFDFKRGCLIGNLGQELAALDTQFRERLERVLLTWEQRVATALAKPLILESWLQVKTQKYCLDFFGLVGKGPYCAQN
jgi:TetR/AcrR family transcriptional repressor of nem operon